MFFGKPFSLIDQAWFTFGPTLPHLPILDESSKHLGLHEDPQESPDALRSHRLAEGFALEDALPSFAMGKKQRIVANGLQEKADEDLWHHTVQRGGALCEISETFISKYARATKPAIYILSSINKKYETQIII